jgi:hypothetical protein
MKNKVVVCWNAKGECTLEQLALAWVDVAVLPHFRDKSPEALAVRHAYREELELQRQAAAAQYAPQSDRERDLSLKAAERRGGVASDGGVHASASLYVSEAEARRYASQRQRYNVGGPPPSSLLDGGSGAEEDGATARKLVLMFALALDHIVHSAPKYRKGDAANVSALYDAIDERRIARDIGEGGMSSSAVRSAIAEAMSLLASKSSRVKKPLR